MRFVRLKQYDEILQGTVACTDIHTADILPDGLFHILQSLLNGFDIRNCIHKCLDGDHRQITSALAACDKLAHVFILACEIPVIQIKSTYIDTAFLKGICHKLQILSGTGCRKSAAVDLLVEKELVFAVLFYVIQSFICFGIAVLKGIIGAAQTQACGQCGKPEFRIIGSDVVKFLEQIVHLQRQGIRICVRKEHQEFISAKSAGNSLICPFLKQLSKTFQCTVAGFVAIDVVDLFQVVHIKEYQTSIMCLHKFRGKTFAQVTHGKTGKEIIAFCVFLTFYGGHYVRDEFADGKLHIRKVIGVRFFLGRIPLRQLLFL